MSKWTHVFIGPSDDSIEGIETEVTAVAAGSPHRPEQIADQMPRLTRVPGCEQVRYVGSGKGDWWNRTMNPADPLVERFQIRELAAGMIPLLSRETACRSGRLP